MLSWSRAGVGKPILGLGYFGFLQAVNRLTDVNIN